jgi:AcrR family transcriptional regulator
MIVPQYATFQGMDTLEGEGLRERKKRQTREIIGTAAMALFQERGFDAVTVADVARAADVSEKTIFNYFPTKEALVFHGEERRAALIAAIRERPAGESVVAPFRRATMAFLDRVEREPVESIVAIPRLVAGSVALRNRLFLGWEEESAVLSPIIAEEAGESTGDLVPTVVARTLAWTHRLAFRAAFGRLLAGEDQVAVAADLRVHAGRAYDALETGLGAYGVKGVGGGADRPAAEAPTLSL